MNERARSLAVRAEGSRIGMPRPRGAATKVANPVRSDRDTLSVPPAAALIWPIAESDAARSWALTRDDRPKSPRAPARRNARRAGAVENAMRRRRSVKTRFKGHPPPKY